MREESHDPCTPENPPRTDIHPDTTSKDQEDAVQDCCPSGEKEGATLHTQGVGDLGPPGSKDRRLHIPYRDTNNRSIPGTWPYGDLPKVNALGLSSSGGHKWQQIPHHTHIFKVEHFYRKLLGTVYLRAFIFPA